MQLNGSLLAVCMPAHNADKHIGNAIESILMQSFRDFTLIITDDCSTDNTLKIIHEFQDDRIVIKQNDSNLGTVETRNRMLNYCLENDFKYMALMDADDISLKDRLRKQLAILECDRSISVCGGSVYVEKTGGIWSSPRNTMLLKAECVFCNPIPTPTAIIRLEHMSKYGLKWDSNYAPCADYHLWYLMLFIHNLQAKSTGDVEMVYTYSPEGVSHAGGIAAQEDKDAEVKRKILECFSMQPEMKDVMSFMRVALCRSASINDAEAYYHIVKELKKRNSINHIVDQRGLRLAIKKRTSLYLEQVPDLSANMSNKLRKEFIRKSLVMGRVEKKILSFKKTYLDVNYPVLSKILSCMYNRIFS